jgi:hypothetical protein
MAAIRYAESEANVGRSRRRRHRDQTVVKMAKSARLLPASLLGLLIVARPMEKAMPRFMNIASV